MRARYLLLVAVVTAGLFSAMAIRSAQGEVGSAQREPGRTLTFRAPAPDARPPSTGHAAARPFVG